MQKIFQSRLEAVRDAYRVKKKNRPTWKTFHFRCWPGIYEAVCRLMTDYVKAELNGQEITVSEFMNILIGAVHKQNYGSLPAFKNNSLKGDLSHER